MEFSFKKLCIRFLIFVFWSSLIFAFLFIPRIVKRAKKGKFLNIFTFPQLIDPEYVHEFEKKTGIKLHFNYYENNNELLIKMRKTGGSGYDVIIPSGYTVEILKKEGLLKKYDKSKLNFLHTIDKRFLGKYFDPNNEYSIPYIWETYKFGINKNFYKDKYPDPSWKLVFDEKFSPKGIVMGNNPREVILLAAFYLFGSIDNLDDQKIEKIKELLVKQKKWVEVYADLRADFLLSSGTCPLAVGVSGEIWQAVRFDKDLDFLMPKEGTFLILYNVAMSVKTEKEDVIAEFLNYLYSSEVVGHHAETYSIFPVTTNVALSDDFAKTIDRIWKETKKMELFRNVLSEEQMNKIWIKLKSK